MVENIEIHGYCEERFESVIQSISHAKRFKNLCRQDSQIDFIDGKNNNLSIHHFQKWMIIILGTDKIDTNKYINHLQENLPN